MAKIEMKKPVVEEIKGYVEKAQSAVLVDYRGLTVEEDTALRKKLREAGVVYKVYKNTMLNFAFEGSAFAELSKHLEGPTAVAFGIEDATAPARVLNEFAKTAPKLEFKAGVVMVLTMMLKVSKLSLTSHPEKFLFPNYLEAYNPQLQTLLVLLSKSLKNKKKLHNLGIVIDAA